jgi:dolichol-phosphate mannosyltransferase
MTGGTNVDGVPSWRARAEVLLRWALGLRYAKFGLVGASGTVVNVVVLTLAQEFLFRGIEAQRERLYLSLALAIAVATVNNFCWNRLWTWADRRTDAASGAWTTGGVLGLFGRYAMASWLGSALQYGLTLWLAHFMHYLLANVLAIVVASVSNFLANDRWTFRKLE